MDPNPRSDTMNTFPSPLITGYWRIVKSQLELPNHQRKEEFDSLMLHEKNSLASDRGRKSFLWTKTITQMP